MTPCSLLTLINRATLLVICIALALTVWLLHYAGDGFQLEADALLIGAWVLLPYVILTPLLKSATRLWRAVSLLSGSLLMSAFAAAMYVEGYLNSMDAQAALVFLFVPMYQLAVPALLATVFLAAGLKAWMTR